jgi:hypothetical protein
VSDRDRRDTVVREQVEYIVEHRTLPFLRRPAGSSLEGAESERVRSSWVSLWRPQFAPAMARKSFRIVRKTTVVSTTITEVECDDALIPFPEVSTVTPAPPTRSPEP